MSCPKCPVFLILPPVSCLCLYLPSIVWSLRNPERKKTKKSLYRFSHCLCIYVKLSSSFLIYIPLLMIIFILITCLLDNVLIVQLEKLAVKLVNIKQKALLFFANTWCIFSLNQFEISAILKFSKKYNGSDW